MLASITPLGERGRGNRWGVTFAWFLAASAAAGALWGAAIGFLGSSLVGHISAALRLGVLGAVTALALAADLHVAGLGYPTLKRQVNEAWLTRYRSWVYGAGFGFQLGLGLTTIISTAAVHAAFAAAFLTGSTVGGFAVGTTFGLVRALSLLEVRGVQDPAALRHRLRDRQRRLVPATRATLAVEGIGLVAAIIMAVVLAAGRIA